MQRLSPGTLILGIFAVLFGLVGAFAAKKYLQVQKVERAAAPAAEALVPVPVAVMDLPAGRTVTPNDVTVRHLAERDLAKAGLPPAWMDRVGQIAGRTLREPVKQGRPFEPTTFYPMGIGPDVAERLQPGERAVSVSYRESAAEASLVTPGATVDVLFRTTPDEKRHLPDATVTLLSRVKVLAVGQSIAEGTAGTPGGTVTLAVNSTQARALKAVEGCGMLSLVLRNSKDLGPAEMLPPTTLPQLLGFKEAGPAFTTQIYKRGQLTTLTFENGQQTSAITADPPYGMPVVGPTQRATPAAGDTTYTGGVLGPVASAEPHLPNVMLQGAGPDGLRGPRLPASAGRR